MTAKHTLGKWTLDISPMQQTARIREANWGLVATINLQPALPHWFGPQMLKARTMAAAPDLLDALEMVRDADDDCKRDGLRTIPYAARVKIDAALKKATGETP